MPYYLDILGEAFNIDMGPHLFQIFILLGIGGGFIAGLWLFITARSPFTGLLLMAVTAVIAFYSWG